MRRIDFDEVFDAAVAASGKVAGTTLTVTQQERIARYVQQRLRRIWTWQFWPELMRYEERDTVEKADGAVYVPREVNFEEEIGMLYENGHVTGVSRRNPKTSNVPDWQDVSETETGLFLPAGSSDSSVFLIWRRPSPRFTRTAYAAGTTYAAGDLVYHAATENCYEAIMASTGKTPSASSAYWRLQEVPMLFEDYVRMGVAADVLREDGSLQEFALVNSMAETELQNTAYRYRELVRVRIAIETGVISVSGTAASSAATEHVEASAAMDWTATGATAVYTVPDGYDLVILGWILTTDTIDTAGDAPVLELGTDADADAFWSGTVQSNAEDAVHVVDRPQNLIASGTVIKATVTTGSTAASHAGKIVIRGHLIATT